MAVAFDASSYVTSASAGVTTIDLTTLTIGSGSDRVLVAGLLCDKSSTPTGITIVWDPAGTNQSLTAITAALESGTRYAVLFGLVNPTSGNKTLRASWTNNEQVILLGASFTGADQTGGDTTFPNGASATGAANPATINVTSAANNMVLAAFVSDGGSFTGTDTPGTNFFADNSQTIINGAASYQAGASTVTMNAGQNAANSTWQVATDIVASSGGGGGSPPSRWTMSLLGVG